VERFTVSIHKRRDNAVPLGVFLRKRPFLPAIEADEMARSESVDLKTEIFSVPE
jgi:hypothetical protein